MEPATIIWTFVIGLQALAILRAATRGHGVEATLAWIFAIIAFPVLGAGAYLLLANPGVRRTTRRKRLSTASVRKLLARRVGRGPPEELGGLRPEERSLLHLAVSLTGISPSGGNSVRLLTGIGDGFERMERAIAAARRTIWAECYLIRNDETGHRFLELLAERARSGIEVRLLYDAFGSLGLDARRLREILAAGGRAEAFLPMNPLRRRWAIHLRNHRKLVVIDGEVGFTGGLNVGDEYSGRSRRRGGMIFRDTHLEVRGPAVGELAQVFAEDWSFATEEELEPGPRGQAVEGGSAVAVLPSGPDQEQNANGMAYFAGINVARERCYITSPYFIPDLPTVRALVAAALRGVDVRILVPEKNDVFLLRSAARSYFPQLVRAGVRVFEYQPSMLHAKTMVVDGAWGMVGSANLDVRSFRLNFELGMLVCDPQFAGMLEEGFRRDLRRSAEVTPRSLSRRGIAARLREGAARLLSPIL